MRSENPIVLKPCIIPDTVHRSLEHPQILELLTAVHEFDCKTIATYYWFIVSYNQLRLDFAASALHPILSSIDLNQVAVIAPGSDGKYEKGPFLSNMYSPLEFLVIHVGQDSRVIAQALLALENIGEALDFDKRIEFKDLAISELCVSGFNGDPKKAWPDRTMNAHLLAGNEVLHLEAHARVFTEWQENSRVRKSVKDYLHQFVQTCHTGLSRKKMQFNLETGDIFYDRDTFVVGLKSGPIRALQVFLVRYQLSKQIFVPLETNTIKKIQLLFDTRDSVVSDAVAAYQQALRIYHWQQYQAKSNQDPHIQLHPQSLQSIVEPITCFIDHFSKPDL